MWSIDPGMAAIAGALISGLVGGCIVAIVNHAYTRRRERERADESLSTKFVDLRLQPYTALMKTLESMSTARMQAASEDEQHELARSMADTLHGAIYGEVGLLASTGTREVILCARSRCARFAAEECSSKDMMDAIWAIHQMLRADLNHHQARVDREIDRVRAKKNWKDAAKREAIERIILEMPHVRWPRVGERVGGREGRRWGWRRWVGRAS